MRAETLLSGGIFIFFCWVLKLFCHHVVWFELLYYFIIISIISIIFLSQQ